MGIAVAADNDDAVDAVIPPSLTKDKDAYIGTSVAFKGLCIGAFTDGATAADVALLHCRHRAAAVTLCPVAALCTAATAADATMLPPTSRCCTVATAGLIGGGGMKLLSLAQSIVNYSELCMGGGMIYRSPYVGIVS